jgi:hypothetical protein
MATIANVSIGLSANSAKLKKDLDKARKSTNKFGAGASKDVNLLGKAIKKLGPAIAAVGFAALARSVAETSKQLGIMSNLTGTTTTRLQQITPSLNRAGISLEKYSDIIKDVNDKTNDFLQTGGGPMADFFDNIAPKVGITADAFKGLSGEEGLQLYIDSLQKAGLSTEEMTFYMEALASDSTMLLPLLRDNAAGMDEFALSSGNAIKPEFLKAVTDLGTNLKSIGTILINLTVNIIGPVIESLAKLSGWLVKTANVLADWIEVGDMGRQVQDALETSLDNTSIAIVDQANASRILDAALKDGTIYSLAQAEAELVKAEARRADILAMEDQRREMALSSQEYQKILRDMRTADDAINFTKAGTEQREDAEQHKIRMIAKQREFLSLLGETTAITEEEAELLRGIEVNISEIKSRVAEWNGENNAALVLTDRVAEAVSNISFENATAGAVALSKELGVSLHNAMQLMGILGAANQSQVVGDPLDPRNPSYNSKANVAERFRQLQLDGILNRGQGGTSSSSRGGGGGGSSRNRLPLALSANDSYDFSMDTSGFDTGGGFKDSSWAKTIASDFAGSLKSELTNALVSGDWSDIGENLMDSITMSIINATVSQGIDFLMGAIGFNQGGIVPSTPNSKSYADSVPAMLQPGELVVPVDQVDNFMSGGSGGGGQTFNINITGDVSRLTRNEVVKMMPEIAAGTNMLNKENGGR